MYDFEKVWLPLQDVVISTSCVLSLHAVNYSALAAHRLSMTPRHQFFTTVAPLLYDRLTPT